MGKYAAMNSVFAVPLRILLAFVMLAFPFLGGSGMASPWYVVACRPLFSDADLSQFITEPVTPLTLINESHYSHFERDVKTSERRLNLDLAQVLRAPINKAEVRLGVTLHAVLRQSDLTQNGGMVKNVFSGDALAPRADDLSPFSGFEEPLPPERICSLNEAIGRYAAEDEIEMFPGEADRVIILAQWCRETLFLDCRNG